MKKGAFREPDPRPPERVVILQKAQKAADEQQGGAAAIADIPVPTSAFAVLKGGESAKSSADLSPFSGLEAAKQDEGSEGESLEEEEVLEPPTKKQRMARTVSINTVLQRVGSKEAPLADVIGTAPQTVEDIVALQSSGNTLAIPGELVKVTEATKASAQPIPLRAPQLRAAVPSLPPRKSSEQSTVEHQRHLALQDSSNTVETEVAKARERGVLSRAFSVERDLHLPARGKPIGAVVETGATPPMLPIAMPSAKEAGEGDTKVVIWSGKIKHRLKTAEGASIVELFSISALVPEKLLEQMPSTLFVSALAGRANVRLGKHYVTQVRLENLEEKQMQKVVTLASMKLVAICELQHCTLTLVPFSNTSQGLRMVGFMIADD